MRLFVLAVAAFILFGVTAALAQSEERDGAQWQSWNELKKYTYLTGLLDGVDLGADLTLPTLSSGSTTLYKPDQACLEKAQSTYNYNTGRYLFGLTLKDFVENLDKFYEDQANQPIPVNKALRVMVMLRKNIPEAGKMLRDLREEWKAQP